MSLADNKSIDVDTTSPDDSLLVSPTAAANSRSQRLGDIDDSMDNGTFKSNIGGMVHINNNNDNNNNQTSDQQRDDNNFLLEDSMLDESFQTLSGGSGDQTTTPMRSKFRTSCASAMEELDFLAPTPCKSSSKTDEKSSSRSEENNKNEYRVDTMESSPVEEEKKQLFTLAEEEDSNLFGVEESTHTSAPTESCDEVEVNDNNKSMDYYTTKTTDTTNSNNTSNKTLCKDAASSAFRHPCIRQSSNESISLELQMAHPVNSNNNSSSFDSSNSTDYYHESTHFNNAKGSMLNDIDLSMEVEKGTSIKSNKEVLVEESRINNIDIMSTAVQTGGDEEEVMKDSTKQLGELKEEEEEHEEIYPENWGELDEGDIDDDQDDSLYDQSSNDTYDPHHHQHYTNEQQADEQHIDEDDQEDSTPGNGDDGAALGYLDSSSDDDSEDDTEINKDYVNTMRDSISSYFSSRSDSSQVENGNNSMEDVAHYKTDVNEEGDSNRSGDDARQIDFGDTLSYATNGIQSVQYQRYEIVLGELKQKGIGSNNIKEDQINNINDSNESQDLSVDEYENVHHSDFITSKPVVKSKYFPETTFEETRPLQNDQFTFTSSDAMVDDSFIQKHAPHTLLGNTSKQAAAATLCDLANQSAVDGTDEGGDNRAAKVNEEKSQFCEQQVGRRDLHWDDQMEDMLELKKSNPFDYDDDSVDAEGEKESTLQSTVHESTSIDIRRWSNESVLPPNIDSISPICGDGSSPHNCELGSDISADSDNSPSNSSDITDLKTEKASIFQVLSQQPMQKQPSKELDDDQSLQVKTMQPDSNNESIDTQEVEQSIVHQEQPSDTPASTKKTLEDSRQSLEDLSSYQQTFSSTSSAFLESLKGAAENRKREVSRVRQSMERKEQILYEERISPSMAAVEEEETTLEPPRNFETYPSMDDHSNRFNASSSCSSTSEFSSKPRASNSSLSAPHHKSSASDENPFIPFMAEPEVSDPRYSTAIGSKRKSSNAFKPHPAQNKSSTIKSSALNVKPPKRLLSSQDSITKSSQEKRSSSTFKARPLPASTFIKPFLREQGKSIRCGKENGTAFVPSSEMRAQERSIYDANKKQREQQQRQDQLDRRNQVIQQTRSEIRELKEKLR